VGSDSWTGVEKEAIADRALQEQQNFLFVVALDLDAVLPDWNSPRRIYWDFHTYGKIGLAGAIKSRIAEMDGMLVRNLRSNVHKGSRESISSRRFVGRFAVSRELNSRLLKPKRFFRKSPAS